VKQAFEALGVIGTSPSWPLPSFEAAKFQTLSRSSRMAAPGITSMDPEHSHKRKHSDDGEDGAPPAKIPRVGEAQAVKHSAQQENEEDSLLPVAGGEGAGAGTEAGAEGGDGGEEVL
jgi:hypothetical protein